MSVSKNLYKEKLKNKLGDLHFLVGSFHSKKIKSGKIALVRNSKKK